VIQHVHGSKQKTQKNSSPTVAGGGGGSRSSPNVVGKGTNSEIIDNNISCIQPKMESSPPPNRSYEQTIQRQTVLMWGSNHSRSSDDGLLINRSPCNTPKSASESFGSFNSNAMPAHEKHSKDAEAIVKWNGNSCGNNKEVISILPIHHNSENSSSSASPNTLHTVDTRYTTNHARHNEISNCEVWPAYSQYQYFPYHHVSNAHHQPTSTQ
jgi:hypothetical protein